MHPCQLQIGTRPYHTQPAIAPGAAHPLGVPLTRSMDSLFTTLVRLDRLIDDMDGCTPAMASTADWLQRLRCVREELDDLLWGHDRMRELLDRTPGPTEQGHGRPGTAMAA